MKGLYENIQEAVGHIRTKTNFQPDTALVLGTGFSALEDMVDDPVVIPYNEIPHFKQSTVKSHNSHLIIGTIHSKPVVMMAGRFHYYEGYSMKEVTFPIRVMHALGANQIFITNASGGLNTEIEAGDIVMAKDHINLMPENPLRGWNDDRLGDRFPDMTYTYHEAFRNFAIEWATQKAYRIHEGVYVGFPGPNLETPAEYRFLNLIGADMVGMSTVPEVIVARHAGMKVAVVSIISNKCFPIDRIKETSIDDVIGVVKATSHKAVGILEAMIKRFG